MMTLVNSREYVQEKTEQMGVTYWVLPWKHDGGRGFDVGFDMFLV